MKTNKPTIRDIKVLLNAAAQPLPDYHYNDRRKNGGRIKLSHNYPLNVLQRLEQQLTELFPEYTISVYSWMSKLPWSYQAPRACVKWEAKTRN